MQQLNEKSRNTPKNITIKIKLIKLMCLTTYIILPVLPAYAAIYCNTYSFI